MKIIKEKTLEKQLLEQKTEVIFCKKCVVSNQRPRIVFDEEGICSACRFAEEKRKTIKWNEREDELVKLLDKHRRHDGQWDVIVPCSGGKDASYVAHQLKNRYNMHPLTITWSPLIYTDIGFQNLQSFISSGFNHILGSPNGQFNRKLARIGFEELGDPFVPFCYGQMCFAFHMALKLGVKLVFYGENGEAEYGGETDTKNLSYRPVDNWATAYWRGCTVDELVDHALQHKDYFTEKDYAEHDLTYYRPPALTLLEKANIQMHWYSYYHKWVPQENYYYSSEHTGFHANAERSDGTYSKYASLDDKIDGIHYYMGYIKFGLGRATSDAAHEIRDNHLTREEGVALVHRYDGEFPKKNFREFLEYLDITEEHYHEVVDSFRRGHLWDKVNGQWHLKHRVS